MIPSLVCVLAFASATHGLSGQNAIKASLEQECPVFYSTTKRCDPVAPKSFLPAGVAVAGESRELVSPDLDILIDMLDALHVMQAAYFAPWLGTWPDAIDWTAAVMGTHVSGAARSLTEGLIYVDPQRTGVVDWRLKENMVEKYFLQITAYYFGQDSFAIRNEAYDDILWVVLGWLETIQFLDAHTYSHFGPRAPPPDHGVYQGIVDFFGNQTYHGNVFIPAFAHRARIFWDLAIKGWDTKLCGGGMIWNPRLLPYKNAITNELFIAASISMYLHFPGDNNSSPFYAADSTGSSDSLAHSGARDPKYLKAAVDGYKWLVGSNMTDKHGLYTDGFHISGYTDSGNNNTKCDLRDNVVLSYNQGVLLTGLRGLWEATGASSYLTDGHQLIQNVIKASGYQLASDTPIDDISTLRPGQLPRWHGLGRAGVMEDPCDASGTCSQDGQTFKGIFFHHLTTFCARLPTPKTESGLKVDARAFAAVSESHSTACSSYSGWLEHNVRAALGTRTKDGKYGQWWTAGLLNDTWVGPWPTMADDGIPHETSGTDYRNYGVPNHAPWRAEPSTSAKDSLKIQHPMEAQPARADDQTRMLSDELKKKRQTEVDDVNKRDPNTRGRGRTVETQGGGLALLRAYWKIGQAP